MTAIAFWGAVIFLGGCVAGFIRGELAIRRLKREIARHRALRYRYELATWLHCDVDDV